MARGSLAEAVREAEEAAGAWHPEPWLVRLDEPALGMWARGTDECDLAAVCVGMRLRFSRRPSADGETSWYAFGRPVELLAADRQFMAGLMRCARLTGLHGTYRECGQTEKCYEF